MKGYVLDTETRASFEKREDAEAYRKRLCEDEENASISEPRLNPGNGMYVVRLYKIEHVQTNEF